ncbi:MAG: metalloregulator ArsR/SmtB family transcription factor [bacterium]
MKKEKSEYSDEEIKLARFAKALGHPARVQILKLLASQDACFCGNIVDFIPLSQSTVSQHLKELKDAGLITQQVKQPKVYYCICRENWEIAKKYLDKLFTKKVCKIC